MKYTDMENVGHCVSVARNIDPVKEHEDFREIWGRRHDNPAFTRSCLKDRVKWLRFCRAVQAAPEHEIARWAEKVLTPACN